MKSKLAGNCNRYKNVCRSEGEGAGQANYWCRASLLAAGTGMKMSPKP